MVLKCAAVVFVTALLAIGSGSVEAPPDALLRENVRQSSVILRGKIESSEAPRPGVTVAHFRVSHSYRGQFKPGDEVAFASFKEMDRYPERFLRAELFVFLRRRRASATPPKWETATDLSEFIFTPELETMLSSHLRKTHR